MESVVNQPGFERVDYIVMDGGSSDESYKIIGEHAARLKHWQSGADGGLYHAVEEGFRQSDADIMGWLNADDMLCPWTIRLVLDIFAQLPQVDFITSKYPLVADAEGVVFRTDLLPGVNREDFLAGINLPGQGWPATNFISQESTFWRRSLWEKAGGGFDHSLHLACDFELWSRFLELTELHVVESPMAIFRIHGGNLSLQRKGDYVREASDVLRRHGWREPAGASWWRRLVAGLKAGAGKMLEGPLRNGGRHGPSTAIAYHEETGRYGVVERGTAAAIRRSLRKAVDKF
jgi:hypothetical protein